MRKIGLCVLLLFTIQLLEAQEIPSVYKNLGKDKNGVYMQLPRGKIYANPVNDLFHFQDLNGNPVGTSQGINLDFKFPKLQGTLYYGFINYADGSYPQPVYFREASPIINGKSTIPIAKNLSGKYDMIHWETTGLGVLGYRIVTEKGYLLYDGKLAFSHRKEKFTAEPTLVEGPFVNKLSPSSVVISFTTTQRVTSNILVNDKTYKGKKAALKQEILIDGLQAKKQYNYTLQIGKFKFTYTFETAPLPGSREKFTFAYSSDSRSGMGAGERDMYGTNAYIVKRIAALAKSENAKFVQFTGDLIDGYDNSKERMNLQYSNWKHAVEPYWHHIPFMIGFGNHEAHSYIFDDTIRGFSFLIDHFPFKDASGESLFQDNFALPENGPHSEDGSSYDPNPKKQDFPSYKESVYWYAYDNVAIVVLNSDYNYTPIGVKHLGGNIHGFIMDNQMKWLEKTLQDLDNNENIDHIFISIHTPFFPNGGHVKDDMWYKGNNAWRPVINGQPHELGIIQRRDELLDIIINKTKKTVALLTGDEHNYNMLPITDEMSRYPDNYKGTKLKLNRIFYQINNGAAGAPYYAQEVTPWMNHLQKFSTQNALVLIDVDGSKVFVRVLNPDTLELIEAYPLRE
ncbi:metallophosphoesterase family protein [Ancylomarina longa]|uniref:Calcineurin-like phosphoesterase domain-containing protein n=1 Tax=Ancylomarina longa TaxID=2487017 RepID=A0A434AVC7_9BACT|nr:metallophosphoesterase [Ancylomarina longa]RUT78400.1 hypothetical protein DLK05_08740 [Ancylomarina longa]